MNEWHWKQTHWNEYVLTGPAGEVLKFESYTDLFIHCVKHDIDATQV